MDYSCCQSPPLSGKESTGWHSIGSMNRTKSLKFALFPCNARKRLGKRSE